LWLARASAILISRMTVSERTRLEELILAALCLASRCANIIAPILTSLKEVQGAGLAK